MSRGHQHDFFEAPDEERVGEGLFDAQLSFDAPWGGPPEPIRTILKRSGMEAAFETAKIARAILRAAESVGESDHDLAWGLASGVALFLDKRMKGKRPSVDDVSDAVEQVLIEMGHARTALAYARYRDRRSRIRRFRDGDVRAFLGELEEARKDRGRDVAPVDRPGLFVRTSDDQLAGWNRTRIVEALVREVDMDAALADVIAIAVEQQIVRAGVRTLTTSLVRELVDAKLVEMGREDLRRRHMRLGVPLYDAEEIICAPNATSGSGGETPADTDRLLACRVKREFALTRVFSQEVADAHLAGDIHLHHLGAIDRLAGARLSAGLVTHIGAPAAPGKLRQRAAIYPETALHQLAQAQSVLQQVYAEPLVWEGLDLFLAPLLEKGGPRAMREAAQQIFALFSRSSDASGVSFWGRVPTSIQEIALPPVPDLNGRTSYHDYESTASQFLWTVLDEGLRGDVSRGCWHEPRIESVLHAEHFEDSALQSILERITEAIAAGARIVVNFDRNRKPGTSKPEVWRAWQPWSVVAHRVTLNLPRAAFRAAGDEPRFWRELDGLCAAAVDAHMQKHAFLDKLMNLGEIGPLGVLGQVWEGRPFVPLGEASWTIGFAGLNECVQAMTGRQIHESEDAGEFASRVLHRLNECCAERAAEEGLQIIPGWCLGIEARRRFAELDVRTFPERARTIVKYEGLTPDVTYTAGACLALEAGMSPLEQLCIERRFHAIVPQDASTTLAVYDTAMSPDALVPVLREAWRLGHCQTLAFELR